MRLFRVKKLCCMYSFLNTKLKLPQVSMYDSIIVSSLISSLLPSIFFSGFEYFRLEVSGWGYIV